MHWKSDEFAQNVIDAAKVKMGGAMFSNEHEMRMLASSIGEVLNDTVNRKIGKLCDVVAMKHGELIAEKARTEFLRELERIE
jgi:hypothetical protein